MNELYRRCKEIKFDHAPGCKFDKQIKDFDFNGHEIKLLDQECEQIGSLTMRYCPYCGFDIDASVAQMLIIKERKEELLAASPIKLNDWIWKKKPNNDYWKGKGFKTQVTAIDYQEHSDRLLYQNWQKGKGSFMSCPIEDIELYTNQPICNADQIF